MRGLDFLVSSDSSISDFSCIADLQVQVLFDDLNLLLGYLGAALVATGTLK